MLFIFWSCTSGYGVALTQKHKPGFINTHENLSRLCYCDLTALSLCLQGFVVAVLYCFLNGEVDHFQITSLLTHFSRVPNTAALHVFQVQHELQRRWRRWRLTQHLPSRRRQRQQHGSLSHSSSPHTQVLLLPYTPPPGHTPSHTTLPLDTMET